MEKIRLFWSTCEGCEWLEEMAEVDNASIGNVCKDYYFRTKQEAMRLLNKWRLNGEDVNLFVSFECENPLYEKMATFYFDKLDEEA